MKFAKEHGQKTRAFLPLPPSCEKDVARYQGQITRTSRGSGLPLNGISICRISRLSARAATYCAPGVSLLFRRNSRRRLFKWRAISQVSRDFALSISQTPFSSTESRELFLRAIRGNCWDVSDNFPMQITFNDDGAQTLLAGGKSRRP